MALVLVTFQARLRTTDGTRYAARACGRERSDGLWEGWIEFVPDDGGPVVRSGRETTQPNLADLAYWATGLTPVYLEGALERTLAPAPRAPAVTGGDLVPAYEGPAPSPGEEERLRAQLEALGPAQLRLIVEAYGLTEGATDPAALDEAEMVELILAAARANP